LPWALILIILAHLLFLHDSGSTSKLFCHGDYDKIIFYSFYWWKDGYNFILWFLFLFFCFIFPFILGDPEIFIEADPIIRPVHIVPEWYFLTSYAILRRVPSKRIGVLIIGIRILVLFLYPLSVSYVRVPTIYLSHVWFVYIIMQFYLSYLGFSPISQPYVLLSLLNTFLYFLYHLRIMFLNVIVSYIFKVIS